MGPTVLFTHLKIILLQCFQFSVFSFSKISSIQTDPKASGSMIFLLLIPSSIHSLIGIRLMSDLGTNHLLIIRRLKVINEPLDHFVFYHGRKHLGSQLEPPFSIFIERFPSLLFNPLKNCAVESFLNFELVILQECIGHLSPAGGLFQSHIPRGCKANQATRENLAKQRMITSIGCHLPT